MTDTELQEALATRGHKGVKLVFFGMRKDGEE